MECLWSTPLLPTLTQGVTGLAVQSWIVNNFEKAAPLDFLNNLGNRTFGTSCASVSRLVTFRGDRVECTLENNPRNNTVVCDNDVSAYRFVDRDRSQHVLAETSDGANKQLRVSQNGTRALGEYTDDVRELTQTYRVAGDVLRVEEMRPWYGSAQVECYTHSLSPDRAVCRDPYRVRDGVPVRRVENFQAVFNGTLEMEVRRLRIFIDGNDPTSEQWDSLSTDPIYLPSNESCLLRGNSVVMRRWNVLNLSLDQLHGTPMDNRLYTYAWNRTRQTFYRIREIGGPYVDPFDENPEPYTDGLEVETLWGTPSPDMPVFSGRGLNIIFDIPYYNASTVNGNTPVYMRTHMDAEDLHNPSIPDATVFCRCWPTCADACASGWKRVVWNASSRSIVTPQSHGGIGGMYLREDGTGDDVFNVWNLEELTPPQMGGPFTLECTSQTSGGYVERQVPSTDVYAYETELDGYADVTVFMDTDAYPGPTPYWCADNSELLDAHPCSSADAPYTSVGIVRRTFPPSTFPMTSLITGMVDEVRCSAYDHFQSTLSVCPPSLFDDSSLVLPDALSVLPTPYTSPSAETSIDDWMVDASFVLDTPTELFTSTRRRLQQIVVILVLSDNMRVYENLQITIPPQPAPPPAPVNCVGVGHGQQSVEERVRFLAENPLSDCLTESQQRSCLCNSGTLSCGAWSPNTHAFDTCTSGCGTERDGEVRYDDFRTRYLEESPGGSCTAQTQARGRECVGALKGLQGSYDPYGPFCVFVVDTCTSDPLYEFDACTPASPTPPPSPPPSPPASPPPPPPPSLPGVCSNTCSTTGNSFCEDGGDGSSNALCTYGTDCLDCGPRVSSPPPPPPSPPTPPSPHPSPPKAPPRPPPKPGFFDNQTNIIIIVSAGGAVLLGILLVVLSYVLTPERAQSLRIVLDSVSRLIGRGGGSAPVAPPPPPVAAAPPPVAAAAPPPVAAAPPPVAAAYPRPVRGPPPAYPRPMTTIPSTRVPPRAHPLRTTRTPI